MCIYIYIYIYMHIHVYLDSAAAKRGPNLRRLRPPPGRLRPPPAAATMDLAKGQMGSALVG